MNVEYKRDLQNNYMILEAIQGTEEDGYRIRMAEQNEIPGLLPFYSGKKDGKLYLHYEITSKQSIENLYARSMLEYQDILFILNGISDTLDAIQKYLLSPAQLLFDPQFIFTYPDKSRLFLCYLPGDNVTSLIELAEFILKRLNHEDSQAVALGYQFYQRALEENFSLQKTLKEILLSLQSDSSRVQTEEAFDYLPVKENRKESNTQNKKNEEWQEDNRDDYGNEYRNEYSDERNSEYSNGKNHKFSKHVIGWLFERIHPMVLLSTLLLVLTVEILFVTGWIRLTEAGGVFFMILSVEILINKFWKNRTKKKHSEWWDEPDVSYEEFQNEVYNWEDSKESNKKYQEYDGNEYSRKEQISISQGYHGNKVNRQRNRVEYTDETRCLITEEPEGMRLYCIISEEEKERKVTYPDIIPGSETVYIGKMQGESDILLDSPTVSRIHARIDQIDDMYYVRDLNSKNGTFVNGERLQPQEQRRIEKGDTVSFAEIVYKAI